MTNGHLTHAHSLSNSHSAHQTGKIYHAKHPSPEGAEGSASDDSDDDDNDDDSDEGDADEDQEETETLTSTSTDDDSEPTIRGPRTVVGWEGESRRSP